MTRTRPSLLELTPEQETQVKRRREEHLNSLTLAYQLGLYIGNDVVTRCLPLLESDSLKPSYIQTVISVTEEEFEKTKELENIWAMTLSWGKNPHSSGNGDPKAWQALQEYRKEVEDKYLSPTLECFINKLNPKGEEEDIKKGIAAALWDSDISHYSCKVEDIVIDNSDEYFTKIILKR